MVWGARSLAALLISTVLLVTAGADTARADADEILLITDSVVLSGAPTVAARLAPRPVHVIGVPAIFTINAVRVAAENAAHVGRTVVIAVGYNYPYWDQPRFDRAVDAMVDTLVGAGAENVVWVMLREVSHQNSPPSSWWQADRYGFYFPDVNAALRRALERNPELSLVDWTSRSRNLGVTYDSIHLNTAGSQVMAEAIWQQVAAAEDGRAARTHWVRRMSGLRPAPRTQPPGDPCAAYASWPEANQHFWALAAAGANTAPIDPDFDLVPCEGRADAPGFVAPPGPAGTDVYPEALTHDQALKQRRDGYWMVGLGGDVFGFGDARALGPHPGAVVTSIAEAGGGGYWLLSPDGTVHARGAPHLGDAVEALVGVAHGEVATAIAAGPDANGDRRADGYWVFTDRGRAIAFGSAEHHGDVSGTPLNGPVVAVEPTSDGRGYWMVASDGGVFTFGNALFEGSTGGIPLKAPVVGIVADPDRRGYWLVASDGGIFAFDAPFLGSTGDLNLNRPVVGAVAHGSGYLLVASDGGIFNFSKLPFRGSLGDRPPLAPVVAVAPLR